MTLTTMEEELAKKLDEQAAKIEAIYVSVEKTRKYFQWTLIVTLAMVVLPLIGLVFAIPAYLSQLSGLTAGL